MSDFSLFRVQDGLLVPQDIARSLWRDDQMHGVATAGALARELEARVAAEGRSELRPARFTVDMFRAPTMDPCRLTSTVVRQGTRLMLVDAVLEQGGEPRARATGLFLMPSEDPDGVVWRPESGPGVPPVELAPLSDDPRPPLFWSESMGWGRAFADHQNGDRKRVWHVALGIVAGETPTGFQAAAGVSDSTSMVVNWGTQGVQYINTDITLALSRVPTGQQLGLSAVSWSSHDGIATGTAIMYDREGPIGTTTVTALANARRTVDFEVHDFGAEHTQGA